MDLREAFNLLGLNLDGGVLSKSELKKAFRKKVALLHPDVSGRDTADDFIKVKNAYDFLMEYFIKSGKDKLVFKSSNFGSGFRSSGSLTHMGIFTIRRNI